MESYVKSRVSRAFRFIVIIIGNIVDVETSNEMTVWQLMAMPAGRVLVSRYSVIVLNVPAVKDSKTEDALDDVIDPGEVEAVPGEIAR